MCLIFFVLLQIATTDELAAIKRLQLHTTSNEQGWNTLHYAAAGHKTALVQQLLQLGADPAAADTASDDVSPAGLTPLHLACMGCVKDQEQLQRLFAEADDDYEGLQVRGCAAMTGLGASC